MRYLFIFCICFLSFPLAAESMPDHYIFQAMKDEMQRTKEDLRLPGQPDPFFVVYQVTQRYEQTFSSSLGKANPMLLKKDPDVSLDVYMYVGDEKQNNADFIYEYTNSGQSRYFTTTGDLPNSYDGIRAALWKATDSQYKYILGAYQAKAETKKERNIQEDEYLFNFSDKASYVEDIPEFVFFESENEYQSLVDELSSMFKEYDFIEHSNVFLHRGQEERYFLDSEGDFYQYAKLIKKLSLSMIYMTNLGERRQDNKRIELPYHEPIDKEKLKEEVKKFLEEAQKKVEAKAEKYPYIGPVLFKPEVSAWILRNHLYKLDDGKARFDRDGVFFRGSLSAKKGMKVISPLFDVYDKPMLREYKGKSLFFRPLDDEGIKPEELKLVEKGKLITLPTSRNLTKGQEKSNGHAFFMGEGLPRARVSNLFYSPRKPLTEKKLEKELLKKCKKLGLEYCYIISSMDGYNEKIYTKDGRKEKVRQRNWEPIADSELRNIKAVGGDMDVWGQIIAPSIIIEEVEIPPAQTILDVHYVTKPFVGVEKQEESSK